VLYAQTKGRETREALDCVGAVISEGLTWKQKRGNFDPGGEEGLSGGTSKYRPRPRKVALIDIRGIETDS